MSVVSFVSVVSVDSYSEYSNSCECHGLLTVFLIIVRVVNIGIYIVGVVNAVRFCEYLECCELL